MRPVLLVALLILPAGAGAALEGCEEEGGFDVCWDDTGDVLVEDPGDTATVETYTSRRDGSGDTEYQVDRTGVKAWRQTNGGGPILLAEHANYQYRNERENTRIVGQEVRVSVDGNDLNVGARRTTYDETISVCHAYARENAVMIPCTALIP
ncbi:MAG TPA: hypothetical protein VI997_01155 [Candidatus Thermoplasmatota archaeon]|nr:hypothetical protein [Candidatus Thermoplasmatota archaeon]